MILLLRMIPLLAGLLNGTLFFIQARQPDFFPWLIVPTIVVYLFSVTLIHWRRWRGAEELRSFIPAIVAIFASGYGLLLTEGMISGWMIPLFVAVTTYAILELQFLRAFVPARYPANGISHVNLLLVPCVCWLAAYTSVGLVVFVNMSRFIPVIAMSALGFVMFYATSQAESTMAQRWRWTWIGTWIGMQVGFLEVVLPLNLFIHAAIAALCCGYALRVRRYGIQPPIPARMMMTEFFGSLILLTAIAATARWL